MYLGVVTGIVGDVWGCWDEEGEDWGVYITYREECNYAKSEIGYGGEIKAHPLPNLASLGAYVAVFQLPILRRWKTAGQGEDEEGIHLRYTGSLDVANDVQLSAAARL